MSIVDPDATRIGIEVLREGGTAIPGETVGLAAVGGGDGGDEAALLEPGDGAVEGARPDAGAREAGDVLHHGVAVARLVGEADEDEKRRLGEAADVAGACLFLASDLSSYCTGITLDVNGGMLIH